MHLEACEKALAWVCLLFKTINGYIRRRLCILLNAGCIEEGRTLFQNPFLLYQSNEKKVNPGNGRGDTKKNDRLKAQT